MCFIHLSPYSILFPKVIIVKFVSDKEKHTANISLIRSN